MKNVFAILLMMSALALPAAAVDLTGSWSAEVNISGNTWIASFTFKQEGNALTGTYKGMLGEAAVKGTIDGRNVRWEFTAEYDGNKFPVVYTGTLDPETVIKGKVDFGGQMDGTFVAKKSQ